MLVVVLVEVVVMVVLEAEDLQEVHQDMTLVQE
jgi:hypothetical protein